MNDDTALSQRLTAAVGRTEGVIGVFAAKPPVVAAADVVAVALTLREPDVLVDVALAEGFSTFTVHVAVSGSVPAPDTLRRVGETVRDAVVAEGAADGEFAVNVKVRLVEDAAGPVDRARRR